MGLAYNSLGEKQKALEYYNQALPIKRSIGDRRGEGITLINAGLVYQRLGDTEKALEYFNQAITVSKAIGQKRNEALSLQSIAKVELKQGRFIEARAHMEEALGIIESTRAKVASQNLRTSYQASKQGFYEAYVDLLMQMHQHNPSDGYDALALQASERARARGLLEMLSGAQIDVRQGAPPELLEHERTLQQQLRGGSERLTRLLSGKHTEEQARSAEKEVDSLLTEYEDVQSKIRAKNQRYALLTQPEPLSAQEIQQQVVDEGTLLLEYALGEERSYLWAVSPTSVASFELPERTVVEGAARRVYEAVTARNKSIRFEKEDERRARLAQADAEYLTAAANLSQMILGPVAGRLRGQRLLIVSDGALQYVPFTALPIPKGQPAGSIGAQLAQNSNYRPLILEHEIISLPSASALAIMRKEMAGRRRAPKAVAVLADPVFQDDDPRVKPAKAGTAKQADALQDKSTGRRAPENALERSVKEVGKVEFRRLPYSRREAEQIAAMTPKGMKKELLDFEANRMTATSPEMSQYRIVHFATHAVLNSQHPELSGVVLSLVDEEGRPQDGFLRLHEIYNMRLGADLVVLSACRTALGKEIKGEGLVGLTRGFMYAGVPRVVASLWAVNDEATAELMKQFYRQLLVRGRPTAAALRHAQVSVWRSKRLPPYYWAAFVSQGEWR